MGSRFTSVVRSRSFVVLFTGLALAGCAQMGDIAPVVDGATRHDASLEAADGTADDGGPVALGRRHVGLRRCAACHQSADPGDGILSGSTMPIRGSSSGVIGYASNLTPDRDTGLGLWTDAQIASAIRGGIDAQGASMCVMPRYAEMTDTEVAAIVAYLRSLPAVAREIDESMCSWDMDAGTAVVDAWTDARADAVIHDASSVTDARRDGGTVSSRDVASALSECTAAWVINEVQTAGAGGASDEFVEIYNRSACAGSLEGYELKYASGAGTTASRRWAGVAGDVIPAHGFALVVGMGFAGRAVPIGTFAGAAGVLAASGGGVGLYDPAGALVDGVGYGAMTSNPMVEGSPVAAPAAGESIARAAGGRDTNDNAADFAVTLVPTAGMVNR